MDEVRTAADRAILDVLLFCPRRQVDGQDDLLAAGVADVAGLVLRCISSDRSVANHIPRLGVQEDLPGAGAALRSLNAFSTVTDSLSRLMASTGDKFMPNSSKTSGC